MIFTTELAPFISFLTTYWPGILLICMIFIYWRGTSSFGTWSSRGVKGPRPLPFAGNILGVTKFGFIEFASQCIKKYGKVTGLYIGRAPALLVADLDMLKQITIKEFSSFTDRSDNNVELQSSPVLLKGLLSLTGQDWKRVRTTITPTFSAAKMKLMVPLMQQSMDILVKKLDEAAETGKSLKISQTFEKLTIEVIMKSAFGVDARSQEDPDEVYTKAVNEFFIIRPLQMLIGYCMPIIYPLYLKFAGRDGPQFLAETAKQVIKQRQEHGHPPHKDLLSLMMKSEVQSTDGQLISKLSDDEIVAQAVTFLSAGQDTTGISLSFSIGVLATHPDIEERLVEEIQKYLPDEVEVNYDSVQNIPYLDKFFNEVLRLYPPVYTFKRMCTKTCIIGGISIPKGAIVMVPIHYIHHDPELWEDPERFDPERFSPEAKAARDPLAFLPFGSGPRNCIGMRFALIEAKMALVRMLKKFQFEKVPETSFDTVSRGRITMAPKNGMYVKVNRRANIE